MELKKQTFLSTGYVHVVQFNMKNNQRCPKHNLTKNIKNILYIPNQFYKFLVCQEYNHQRSWIFLKLAIIEA